MGLLSGGAITQDPEKKKRQQLARIQEEADRARYEYERRLDDIRRTNYSERDRRDRLAQYEGEFNKTMAGITKRMEEAENGKRAIKKVSFLSPPGQKIIITD